MRNLDLAAELGARGLCGAGAAGTARNRAGAKDIRAALDREAKEASHPPAATSWTRAMTSVRAGAQPNEPRGDILLPTAGHALAFINELEHPELVGLNPEVGHEEMASLNYAHDGQPGPLAREAVPHRPERPARPALRPGPAVRRRATHGARSGWWTLEAGGYDGPVHFDYKPPRTENDDGVWASAAACMRNYLILREKVRAFRPRPGGQGRPWRRRGSISSAEPTLGPGESLAGLRGAADDPAAAEAMGARGMAFEQLDQLALEHLYGTR